MDTFIALITHLDDIATYLTTHLRHHLPTIEQASTWELPELPARIAQALLALTLILGAFNAVTILALLLGKDQHLIAAWAWTWGTASPTIGAAKQHLDTFGWVGALVLAARRPQGPPR